MKVLILGNGAREHALAWKFSTSRRLCGLFIAPGNAGTASFGTNLPSVDPLNGAPVVAACQAHDVDLVFVGGETPLEAGVVDALRTAGIAAIGPDKHRALLESSKVFSKDFMVRNHLPTAAAQEFSDPQAYEKYVKSMAGKIVVKKSGLAAGKGVLETADQAEALAFGLDILKSDKLLVEEFLTGFEISVFVLSDGKDYVVLPPTADFKKAKDGDLGPNTGGMGAICPVPLVDAALWKQVLAETVEPTVAALNKDKLNYKGIVFIGLMITAQGPKILEYNTRFGDPETQALLSLIDSDFGDLAQAIGGIRGAQVAWVGDGAQVVAHVVIQRGDGGCGATRMGWLLDLNRTSERVVIGVGTQSIGVDHCGGAAHGVVAVLPGHDAGGGSRSRSRSRNRNGRWRWRGGWNWNWNRNWRSGHSHHLVCQNLRSAGVVADIAAVPGLYGVRPHAQGGADVSGAACAATSVQCACAQGFAAVFEGNVANGVLALDGHGEDHPLSLHRWIRVRHQRGGGGDLGCSGRQGHGRC